MKLSDTIAAAGSVKPWCGGIGSGTATGWPATDWLEEIVMRQYGPDVYDKWVSHDVKFDSPEIKAAMATLEGWMKNPKYVNGGHGDVASIATTTFQDAGLPILQGQCYMLQQASFYAAQFPQGHQGRPRRRRVGLLPAADERQVRRAGRGWRRVRRRASPTVPRSQAVQTYLSTPEWATSRIKVAQWLGLGEQRRRPARSTPDPIDKLSAQYLTDPKATFRFDASDLMPAAVGAGAEWSEFTVMVRRHRVHGRDAQGDRRGLASQLMRLTS